MVMYGALSLFIILLILTFCIYSIYTFIKKRSFLIFLISIPVGILLSILTSNRITQQESITGHYTMAGGFALLIISFLGLLTGMIVQHIYIVLKGNLDSNRKILLCVIYSIFLILLIYTFGVPFITIA